MCFSVSESMSVTYLQTYRHTEPLLEVLADLKTARPDLKKSLSLDFKLVSHSELLTFDRVWATYTLLYVQYMCALTFRTFRSEDALIR